MMHAPGLFDLSDHLARLSATGDPLEALERHVDFEAFRTVLMEASVMVFAPRAVGHPMIRSRCSRCLFWRRCTI